MENVKFVKVTDLEGFNPQNFSVDPMRWGYKCITPQSDLLSFNKVCLAAKSVENVCIAIVIKDGVEYVFSTPCHEKSYKNRFILFNASKAMFHAEASLHAVINRSSQYYFYEAELKYKEGSVI